MVRNVYSEIFQELYIQHYSLNSLRAQYNRCYIATDLVVHVRKKWVGFFDASEKEKCLLW